MRKTLTETVVTKTKAPADGRLELLDTITPGFGLRITPAGTRTYFAIYRINGDRKQHRLTIGDAAEKSLADARKAAQAAIASAQAGKDPKLRRVEAVEVNRAEDAAIIRDRFENVARQYIKLYVKPKLREARAVELMLEKKVIPEWKGRDIRSLTRREVVELLDKIGAATPVRANRIYSLLSRLFGWTLERGIIEQSPMAGLKKPHKERTRDRVLADEEIRAIWQACDVVGYPGGALARLLLLSACRLNEIARLTRAQIDGDLIMLPETKSGRAHVLPITKQIRTVLDALPEFGGEYLLTSTAGKRPMQNFADTKAKLDKESRITGWTFHDMRRTAASSLGRLKVAPHIIEAVLNHSSGVISGVAAIYNRYSYSDEKRAALELWGREVDRIVAGKPRLTVVRKRA